MPSNNQLTSCFHFFPTECVVVHSGGFGKSD